MSGGFHYGDELPPLPKPATWITTGMLAYDEEAMQAYAREAIRLAATVAPVASEPRCLGDPGECAYNGACMYACGRSNPPVAPVASPDVQAFVEALTPDNFPPLREWTVAVARSFAVQAINAWQARAPVASEDARDAARYRWLLHNGGLLNEWPREWQPKRDGKLIPWLEKRIDQAMQEGK